MEFLNKNNLDTITCGMYINNSYYGYKSSILKSGICKYYRREEFDKFEWCVVEMILFGIKDKGLLTNLINRIKILLMEEIVCIDMGDVIECIKILNELDSHEFDQKLCKMLEIISIVKQCSRGRIVSYINNWWRHSNDMNDINNIDINNISDSNDTIKKYRKKNDSEELLHYGKLFIKYLEEEDERMFQIFNKVFMLEGTYGTRYRRKDSIYLLFEIIEDRFKDDVQFMILFDFCKTMFFKKNMKERYAFGVWLLLTIWKYKEISFQPKYEKIVWNMDMLKNYIQKRQKIEINEDYVVNDYHVNKKHGLAKFGNVGSLVTNENLTLLGNNGPKYKQFYIDIKNKANTTNTTKKLTIKTKTSCKEKPISSKNNQIKIIPVKRIDWCEFKNEQVLEDGVCGLKVCCIKVIYKNKCYILKEMRTSFNNGRDYILIDSLKKHFNVSDLGMKRISSNIGLEIVDKKIRSLKKNWKLSERGSVIYCMMNNFENIGDIGKHKHYLETDSVFKECLKIMLYDGLFRSSDNILRNILVNKDGSLMSIDEGDIYGKRPYIFGKNDWFKRKENIGKTREFSQSIIDDWDLNNKIPVIKKQMELYKFENKIEEMESRISNYKSIVAKELED